MAMANATRRLRRSIPAIEWVAWGVGACLSAWLTVGHLVKLTGAAIDAPINADSVLLVTAAAAVFVPLRMLLLVTAPGHYAVRRGLGESPASILAGMLTEATILASATVVPTLLFGVIAALSDPANSRFVDALALHVGGLWTVHLLAVAATNRALVRVFDGGGAWRAISGGGAFGPAQTAPLLYAPAVAYALGLVPTALAIAWLNGSGDWQVASNTSGLPIWPVFAFAGAVLTATFARVDVTSGRAKAAAGLVLVAELLKRGFVRSEAVAEPGAWLLVAAREKKRRAALQFMARSWVRRYPASHVASVVLVAWAAWLLQPGSSVVSVALVALGIGLYSVFRAYDLLGSLPHVAAAVDTMTAPVRSHERALGDLAIGLGVPGLAVLLLGWSENQWLGAAIGAGLSVAAAAIGTRGKASPARAWIGRFGVLLVLVGVGFARWEVSV